MSKSLRQRTIRWRLIVIIATLIAFSPVVRHDFGGWDDEQNLTLNPQMNPPTLSAVASYWRAPKFDLYVPVTWTVWSALARIGYFENAPSPAEHLNPYIFHTSNLALHATSALLAFELLRRLLGRDALVASAAGALLFAVHPVQVEPVAWVSGLKDVLAGMLAIAAMVLFLDDARSAKRYVAAMIVLVLAILSKPSAIVVPVLVIVFDTLVRRTPFRQSIVRFAPALALAIAGAIIARIVQQAHNVPNVEIWKRPLIAADAISFYLGNVIVPHHLGVHYGRTPQYVLSIDRFEWFWLTPIVLVLALLLSRNRFVLGAVAIFLIGIAPVLGFTRFDFQEYSTVADHYLYLAMLGPALLIGWLALRTKQFAIVSILILTLGALTWRQSRTWHDAISISRQAVHVNPGSKLWRDRLVRLLMERGNAYADQGQHKQTIDVYHEVLSYDPQNAIATANLASVLAGVGEIDKAIDLYERALELDPNLESARVGLERARTRRGK